MRCIWCKAVHNFEKYPLYLFTISETMYNNRVDHVYMLWTIMVVCVPENGLPILGLDEAISSTFPNARS